jgi:hypothetical protein
MLNKYGSSDIIRNITDKIRINKLKIKELQEQCEHTSKTELYHNDGYICNICGKDFD